MTIQDRKELEEWHSIEDPWGYENSSEDEKRKQILLSEIPEEKYSSVLDIGCGQGFITRELPGSKILGIDISFEAIERARKFQNKRLTFEQASIFELPNLDHESYDLIVITGVIYPQYVGKSLNLLYHYVNQILKDDGVLVSVHINEWYSARFPYLQTKLISYPYREFTHRLEVYRK